MADRLLGRHVFIFNEDDNGGESLCLTTTFFDNGDGADGGIYTNQELTLQSYCNSASFELIGAAISPRILRKLANELESEMIRHQTGLDLEKKVNSIS